MCVTSSIIGATSQVIASEELSLLIGQFPNLFIQSMIAFIFLPYVSFNFTTRFYLIHYLMTLRINKAAITGTANDKLTDEKKRESVINIA
jgi:hypothetical protein